MIHLQQNILLYFLFFAFLTIYIQGRFVVLVASVFLTSGRFVRETGHAFSVCFSFVVKSIVYEKKDAENS